MVELDDMSLKNYGLEVVLSLFLFSALSQIFPLGLSIYKDYDHLYMGGSEIFIPLIGLIYLWF